MSLGPYRQAVPICESGNPAPSRAVPLERGSSGTFAAAVVASLLAALALLPTVSARTVVREWAFTEDVPHVARLGLATPVAVAGDWEIADHEGATGGRALLNHEGSGELPAIAVTPSVRAAEARAVTRCRVRGELASRACGLVFAFRDLKNYHVARVDVGAGRVVLASVVGGRERVLSETPLTTPDANGWFEIAVEARAREVDVWLDGARVVTAAPIASPGGAVGLWAPPSGAAAFDRLRLDADVGPAISGL